MLMDAGADPYVETSLRMTALDFALLGSPHPRRFTALKCQTETVRAIRKRAPLLRPRLGAFDKILLAVKACPKE